MESIVSDIEQKSMEKNKHIYATITPTIDGTIVIKFGDTFDVDGRSTYTREYLLTEWIAIDSEFEKYRDNLVHQFLDKGDFSFVRRFSDGGTGREQFICTHQPTIELFRKNNNLLAYENGILIEDTKQSLLNLVNKIRIAVNTGIVNRSQDFKPRDEQLSFIEKFSSIYKEGKYKKGLLGAKPRSGKTYMSYKFCLEVEARNVLVITSKPAIKSSWKSDLESHVDFFGCNFYDYTENSQPEFSSDSNMNVFFVSAQALNASTNYDWIYDFEWDVIVWDETHYGSETELSTKILNRLTIDKKVFLLQVSATPFKQMLNKGFNDENSFYLTYIDEQIAKAKELQDNNGVIDDVNKTMYQMCPRLEFLNVDLRKDDRINKLKDLFGQDGMPTWAKIFQTDKKGLFVYDGAVENILDTLRDISRRMNGLDKKQFEHMMITVPGIDAGDALCSTLNKHHHFKDYEVINCCGSSHPSIESVVNGTKIYNSRTIIVTCGRYLEGVTIPKLGCVVMMDDFKSPTRYIQAAFRAQNPYVENAETYKKVCYVVDFNLNRVAFLCFYQAKINKTPKQTLEEAIRDFLACAPIYNLDLIIYSKSHIPYVDIINAVRKACDADSISSFVERVISTNYTFSSSDGELLNMIAQTNNGQRNLSIILSESEHGITNGKTFENVSKGDKFKDIKRKKERDLEREQYEKRLKTIITHLPIYLYFSPLREHCVDDIFLSLYNNDQKTMTLFQEIVGIDLSVFRVLIEKNHLNKDVLDDIINAFANNELFEEELYKTNDNISILLESQQKFNKFLSRSSSDTITPLTLVNELIGKLPNELFTSTTNKFLDPTCGTGTFIFALIERCYNALQTIIPDENERILNILNRIYGFDTNKILMNSVRKRIEDFLLIKFGIVGANLHLYNEDVLTYNFNGMKFDVIVGNPPFQPEVKKKIDDKGSGSGHKIWHKFIEKSFELANEDAHLVFVTPHNWRTGCFKSRASHLKAQDLIFNNEIIWWADVRDYKGIDYFPEVGHSNSVDSWYVIKNNKNKLPKLLCNLRLLPKQNDKIILSILEKFYELCQDQNLIQYFGRESDGKSFVVKDCYDEKFCYKVANTSAQVKKDQFRWASSKRQTYDLKKVLVSDSGQFVIGYDPGTMNHGGHVGAYIVSNEIEGNQLTNFLQSKLIKFISSQFMRPNALGFPMELFKHLPNSLLTKDWKQVFNFTVEELSLIENSIS